MEEYNTFGVYIVIGLKPNDSFAMLIGVGQFMFDESALQPFAMRVDYFMDIVYGKLLFIDVVG